MAPVKVGRFETFYNYRQPAILGELPIWSRVTALKSGYPAEFIGLSFSPRIVDRQPVCLNKYETLR